MRTSVAALALIRRNECGQTLWLAQWNRNWRRFNFVGGHRLTDESFRGCVAREVGEELGLVEGTDFFCPDEPLAHLEYTARSGGSDEETAYTVELFDVRLCSPSAAQKVEASLANRWLTSAEIAGGRCADGQLVSETMALLLAKAGVE